MMFHPGVVKGTSATHSVIIQASPLIRRRARQPIDTRNWFGLCLCLCLAWVVSPCSAAELIVHQGLSVPEISRNEARLYLTMRLRNWPDGTPVQVFVLPDDDPLHHKVVTDIFGLFPHQLRRAWDRQLFSGTGQVPTTVPTEAELIQRVAATPGALGYARSASGHPGVQLLKVR